MGEIKGFLKYDRVEEGKEKVNQRIKHYHEFLHPLSEIEINSQGARCMECGVPFCQSSCPVDNLIPEWNDLAYKSKWQEATTRLLSTNNFPEFTGRVCPAPCEDSCVVAINKPAVSIKAIEKSIIENAFKHNLIKPIQPLLRTGKKVAIVGSGPAGLAAADQLNKLGHEITIFEKNEVIGGLLSLGIPDFKLEKKIVERRIKIMKEEGIKFKTNVNVGMDLSFVELQNLFDSIILCGGAEKPRNLEIEGRNLDGIHFAMDFLKQQNRKNRDRVISDPLISAKDKNVIVIGGGDTGSDCIGTSIRQGAKTVINLELMPEPSKSRLENNPWPEWAIRERTSSSHEEGCERMFSVLTKEFIGENSTIKKIKLARVNFSNPNSTTGKRNLLEIPNSEFELDADLVIIAMGFTGVGQAKILNNFGIILDEKGNVKSDNNHMTEIAGVFVAGDMRTGQSIVVKAINDGRKVAEKVNKYLSAT